MSYRAVSYGYDAQILTERAQRAAAAVDHKASGKDLSPIALGEVQGSSSREIALARFELRRQVSDEQERSLFAQMLGLAPTPEVEARRGGRDSVPPLKGICPRCEKQQDLRRTDGRVKTHATSKRSGVRCPGSGEAPMAEEVAL